MTDIIRIGGEEKSTGRRSSSGIKMSVIERIRRHEQEQKDLEKFFKERFEERDKKKHKREGLVAREVFFLMLGVGPAIALVVLYLMGK